MVNSNGKKEVQVELDNELVDQADKIFDQLNLDAQTVIGALYSRVVANGEIPFELELTPSEMNKLDFDDWSLNVADHKLTTDDEIADFIDED